MLICSGLFPLLFCVAACVERGISSSHWHTSRGAVGKPRAIAAGKQNCSGARQLFPSFSTLVFLEKEGVHSRTIRISAVLPKGKYFDVGGRVFLRLLFFWCVQIIGMEKLWLLLQLHTKVDDTHTKICEESAVWMTEGHMKPLRTKKLAKWTSASSAPNMRSISQFSTPMISTLMSN